MITVFDVISCHLPRIMAVFRTLAWVKVEGHTFVLFSWDYSKVRICCDFNLFVLIDYVINHQLIPNCQHIISHNKRCVWCVWLICVLALKDSNFYSYVLCHSPILFSSRVSFVVILDSMCADNCYITAAIV